MPFNFRPCIAPLHAYVPGRPAEEVRRAYGLAQVHKLASNENPLGCSPAVAEAVAQTFAEAPVYPDGYCTALREAVGQHYGIVAENLIFGAGTDEVIAMLGKIFIEPGDESVTAAVTFSQYAAAVESMGGQMVYAPMRHHGYDLDAILAHITPRTKLVFLTNPNNPTGTYHSGQAQADFMAQVPENVVVVIDEAYQEYVAAPDYPDTLATLRQYPNAVLLKTFSKVYGLAAFRVGFGVAHPAIIQAMEKIRCPFNVSTQAQAAACVALADQAFVQTSHDLNRTQMARLATALEKMGCPCIPSQANFVMTDVGRDSRKIFEALMAKGYIIRAGAAFGMDSFIRITVGTQAQMDGFLAALASVL